MIKKSNNTFNKKRRFTINNKITKNKRKAFYICSSFSFDNILQKNKN